MNMENPKIGSPLRFKVGDRVVAWTNRVGIVVGIEKITNSAPHYRLLVRACDDPFVKFEGCQDYFSEY